MTTVTSFSFYLLLFYWTLLQTDSGHIDTSHHITYHHDPLPKASYPLSKSGCVSTKNLVTTFFHCENKVCTMSLLNSYLWDRVFLECNSTLGYSDLEYDYPDLMALSRTRKSFVYFTGCPEPRVSYAAFVFPQFSGNGSSNRDYTDIQNNIRYISILCLERETFYITRNHLDSLGKLNFIEIRCAVLTSLPADLFQGTTPELEAVHVYDTRLEHIPSLMFHNLAMLKHVHLRNNQLSSLHEEAFLGCPELSSLFLDGNRLKKLGQKLLMSLSGLSHLILSDNQFREIPRQLYALRKIRYLHIQHNRLEKVGLESCEGLAEVKVFDVSYNGISKIDPGCFEGIKNVTDIDVSGNRLHSDLTWKPVKLDRLKNFYFSENSGSELVLKRFFDGEVMESFQMRNSNVVSVEAGALRGYPGLKSLDLSYNGVKDIPAGFLGGNPLVRLVDMHQNEIASLPKGAFLENPGLERLNLSGNRLDSLQEVFPANCTLKQLDLSFNDIKTVPETFLSNVAFLKTFKISNNGLRSLGKGFFSGLTSLTHLDLSYNRLEGLHGDIFLPLKHQGSLKRLELQGNRIPSLPALHLAHLEHLDVSRNLLRTLPNGTFYQLDNLKHLNLSRNLIAIVGTSITRPGQGLKTMDISHNRLTKVTEQMLSEARELEVLDLSHNRIETFEIDTLVRAGKLLCLNISGNGMRRFAFAHDSTVLHDSTRHTALRILDLSNNSLDLTYSPSIYEEMSTTWGRVSPFLYFSSLEELLLSNNSIDSIFLDWRIDMPNLKKLDLRDNVIEYLTHQDILFSTNSFHESLGFGPYPCSHNLTVDLRNNRIKFVELPLRMLEVLPKRNETRGVYSNVKILLEDNPFECGCAIFNLLKVIKYDVVLTSELKRNGRGNWILPAKLDVGSLSCWKPDSVRGKRLNSTEEWTHHLVPLYGLCCLLDETGDF